MTAVRVASLYYEVGNDTMEEQRVIECSPTSFRKLSRWRGVSLYSAMRMFPSVVSSSTSARSCASFVCAVAAQRLMMAAVAIINNLNTINAQFFNSYFVFSGIAKHEDIPLVEPHHRR